MQSIEKIIECYDKTAKQYTVNFINELSKKPFDRLLLEGFARANKGKKKIADLGCGPGQTTAFLKECGIKNITGIDISQEMIKRAKSLHPEIRFEAGDMMKLNYRDRHFDGVVAFYAIVNFDYRNVRSAFKEISRVLKKKGQFLFSFHTGEKKIHLDNFLNENVEIDFYFFNTEKIIKLLKSAGFNIISAIERYPHEKAEYPSKRAYIHAEKL